MQCVMRRVEKGLLKFAGDECVLLSHLLKVFYKFMRSSATKWWHDCCGSRFQGWLKFFEVSKWNRGLTLSGLSCVM